jgi:hypothetical protein
MGGDPVPRDEPCGGQQEHPAANRCDPPRAVPSGGDPADQRRIEAGLIDSAAACHHQRVDPAGVQVSHSVRGVDRQAAA